MARTFLYVKENDFLIYHNPEILTADALIIDVYDASCLFANFHKLYHLLEQIKEKGIKLFLRLDCNKPSSCYKALDLTIGSFLSGFYLDDPSPRKLRIFNLKIREYELKQKLPYESLSFLVNINKARHVNRIKKIARNSRIQGLFLQAIPKVNMAYVTEKITNICFDYKITLLNLEQMTSNPKNLNELNKKFTPTTEEIEEAILFLQELRFASRKKQKELLKRRSLSEVYRIINTAKRLDLIQEFPQIHFIKIKKNEKIIKKPLIIKKFYTVGEEIANAITHGIGAGLAIAGLVLLMVKGGTTKAILSYLAFAVSALILYLSSTLYHSLSLGNLAKLLFNKIDHMTIYLLIAGTYTPFALLAIGGKIGNIICLILWSGAILGMLLNLFAFGRFRLFHMILYVVLGWFAIFFLPDILSNISSPGVILLILGGLMYSIGIFFYSLKLFKFSHMVWHIFTILGTLAHFFTLFYFV